MLINMCFSFMMFIVSLIEFSKHVQNEISAKVMPKPQNFTADFADRTDRRNYDPPKTPNYAERTTGPRSEVSVARIFSVPRRDNFNGLVRHYFMRRGANVADIQSSEERA